jgi:hypothetical protein
LDGIIGDRDHCCLPGTAPNPRKLKAEGSVGSGQIDKLSHCAISGHLKFSEWL